ncbi:MAG: phosphodiester glycosidase family protein [Candidatus Niameybacter stercoravium]|nr:phosphodiester glycosidase family protein [Candidatus Niameybacter stercoravium]
MKARKLLLSFMIGSVALGSTYSTYGAVLHEITQSQTVTNGATHISKQVLTDSGWQDLNILKIDLSNDNVVLKPIQSSVLGERNTIMNLATSAGALAAVNADYFDMSTKTPAFGPSISEGSLNNAYHNDYYTLGPQKYMGTLIVDEEGQASMDYYSVKMWVETDGQKAFDLSSYNKTPSSIRTPFVIDRTYYVNNAALISKYQQVGLYTVLIEDDTVSYISGLNEIVEIPKDAYAIMISGDTFNKYIPYLEEGSEIVLQQVITLNNEIVESVSDLQMGIGGGGLILKNGQAYQGQAHKVSGDKKEPRTIVANTYTPNEVLLITIDGRTNQSLGANHTDLIKILQELGAKDAMYLDGGGSTTMVVRNEGDMNLTLQNKPSGGSQRNVANGIGVFSTMPQGELAKIIIEPSRERTFVGESVPLILKGVDENGNSVALSSKDVSIQVAGVTGSFNGLNFTPESQGDALIMVTAGDVTGTAELKVTKPTGLIIEPATLQMNEQTTKQVQVYGVDQEGYKVPITAEKIKWTSENGKVTAAGNSITSTKRSVDRLNASYAGATGKLNVVVGETTVALESFEETTGKWAASSKAVEGKVEPSKEIKYHGNQAIKMTYTFNKDANKQVAYTVFEKPVVIPEDARSLNMWIYANGQGDTLKVQVEDASGQVHYLKLADSLSHKGWKYMSVNLPEDMKLPAKMTKLYTYTSGNTQKRTSAIYIDHVSITRGQRDLAGTSTRLDYQFDPLYKPSLQAPVGNQYVVKVTGPTALTGLTHSEETLKKMADKLNKDASAIIQASSSNLPLAITKELYTYANSYSDVAFKDIEFIFAGTDGGGIRQTSASQWNMLKQSLEMAQPNNIILVMSRNPLTQFNDAREGQALHDYLKDYKAKTGKNIFVVTTGSQTKEVRLEEGIRYIRLNGLATPTDKLTDGEYLLFKVVDGQIYYTFESMM